MSAMWMKHEVLLQYSFWDHNLKKWFTTALDCGRILLAGARFQAAPAYFLRLNGKLKHAYWDGSSWQKQTIPLPTKELALLHLHLARS